MMITVEQIMAWEPCEDYNKMRVRGLIGDGKTPLEILDLDIPPEDRIWCLCQRGALPEKIQLLFAADCEERALKREQEQGRKPDPRSWAAVEVARRYARGKATEEELEAAKAAARAAAWAGGEAAWEAARAVESEE